MMIEAERQIISAAIEFTGTVAGAARYLQIPKSHLYRRMRKIDLPTPNARDKDVDVEQPVENAE